MEKTQSTLRQQRRVIPGFRLSLTYTLIYLGLLVFIPLSGLFVTTAQLRPSEIWGHITSPQALAAFRVSLTTSFVAALVNALFGMIVAWVMVRYSFPGKKVLDAFVDLPFALPTAVAGIALTTLYAPHGWLGAPLAKLGIHAAYTPLGIVIALVFIGLPFVVRTIEPVLQECDPEFEEAAASLSATRWQIFSRVIFPQIFPAILTGFALAFARGLGEYGSVIFIAGNLPMISQIVPLLIVIELEEFNYPAATSIAAAMLLVSFALLLAINQLNKWTRER
jgi:sulfate transport system permease protein